MESSPPMVLKIARICGSLKACIRSLARACGWARSQSGLASVCGISTTCTPKSFFQLVHPGLVARRQGARPAPGQADSRDLVAGVEFSRFGQRLHEFSCYPMNYFIR